MSNIQKSHKMTYVRTYVYISNGIVIAKTVFYLIFIRFNYPSNRAGGNTLNIFIFTIKNTERSSEFSHLTVQPSQYF